MPAIWPCGSIASAVKFEIISPKANIINAESAMNSGSGSICSFAAASMIAGDGDVADQRGVGDHAHAEAADEAGVDEAGDGGADGDAGKRERKIMPELVDAGEHLLRR